MNFKSVSITALVLVAMAASVVAEVPLVRQQELLDRETFWDNRDWDWYKANIPFFECPDADIQTTYYYRWELLTKHLTYGSPGSGYSFTEFIDRPFWSGAYGAISCPAGHQLYEARWLRDPRYARDYARYWFSTRGAQPRNYSTWLADSVWAVHRAHPDDAFVKELLPGLKKNFEGWEARHFVPEVGLFWQTGHDDGMEFNINSRQTTDTLRGAPGYRPTINAYMWADALAIARAADLAGDTATGKAYRAKADGIKGIVQKTLWDPERQFFFPLSMREEEADGFKVKARTLTYQTGRHAGSPYGRELIGYVPWQFSMPDAGKGYEAAWKKLTGEGGFAAPFGPTTVERNDPMFLLKKTCCWWSGQSWPYATSQTLKALANLLQSYEQGFVTKADYLASLRTFARTHRKNGKPYIAEGCDPETGSFEGHDAYNHSEHYFHSSFNDLVITGLVGLVTRDDDVLEVKPLAPPEWAYFALDGVPYRGHLVSIVWDRDGSRYGRGKGLRLFADGKEVAASEQLLPLSTKLPAAPKPAPRPETSPVNFAVNNDGTYFPRVVASFSNTKTPVSKLVDGNYWYHRDPPNRWTCEGSSAPGDTVAVEFGSKRTVDAVKLYVLDDGTGVVPPSAIDLEYRDGKVWLPVPGQTRTPVMPEGRRANVIRFPALGVEAVRAVLHHAANGKTGMTEFEVWGDATRPIAAAPHPAGDLAYNPGDKPFPKASASHSDRFGGLPNLATDGKTNFLPSPINRWTSYESPDPTDWLEIDFGAETSFNRIEQAIYDDRGGVQPPTRYDVEFWHNGAWQAVTGAKKAPSEPTGGQFNEVLFGRVKASKVRVVFTHAGKARSGVSEILIWDDRETTPRADAAEATGAKAELRLGKLRVGKVLFLGNSVTRHPPAPAIGWSGDWGMAASAREKDFVHLLLRRIEEAAGGRPDVMIKNIADFERNPTGFDLDAGLKDALAFEADLVVIAVGANVPALKTDEARTGYRTAFSALLAGLKRRGDPVVFVRGEFWDDPVKEGLMKEASRDAGATFVGLGGPAGDAANLARSERKFDHDGVAGHPGDRGMRMIADALWKAIQKEANLSQ